MDYNAIETQGVEITAEKEDKKMKGMKTLKKVGKIALGVAALGAAFLLGKNVKSKSSDDTEYEYFDPEIDTVESNVNDEE